MLREQIHRTLKQHRFCDLETEIVWIELQTLAWGCATEQQANLAAHLTRSGFPDVDLDPFFADPSPSEEEIFNAIQLLASGQGAKTQFTRE